MRIKVNAVDLCSSDTVEKKFRFLDKYGIEYEISDNPDFLIYEPYGNEHLKYDCVRIFVTGENVRPDFNICDYAVGFDYMQFGDRYLRKPLYRGRMPEWEQAMHRDISMPISERKFCNFIYSNGNADPKRTEFYEALSHYKKVDSGGRYLNNIGGGDQR